ncbi:transglycosylase domain-containing protein [Planococcus salinus]|uniref:Penicillin-binding protein n=1 Tax=Planococcus salinus TaxID=1848460 RepID=A0A3M8PAS0_9BACL|nr:transglycosylase domain-containing protein [Planococcus salinus]RNF40815.1 penicillin-binding protein [Planococcus salinus]
MRDKLTNWLNKAEDTYNRLTAAKWFKRLSITGGVFWNLALILAIVLVTGGTFAASVGAGYFASLVDDEKLRTAEEMRNEIYSYEETSEMFFADELYIGKVQTDLEREETKLENVSEHAINAVLATEDEYFNEHEGIVPKAILRGLFQDISNSDNQTGGSTLTQQLIKNQILTNEVSYERKAKEILLAMRLEKFMSKDEIMEAYLNIIPYGRNSAGSNIAGIETAASGIFNVSASELTLPQAAFIAGIPKAPFRYTPYTSVGEIKEGDYLQFGIDRMKTVLYRMEEAGYITPEEYEEALAYDITKDFRQGEQRSYERYPYITVELQKRAARILMDVLAEEDGITPEELEENENLYEEYAILAERAVASNGYRIHSTINKEVYEAQKKAAEAYDSYGSTRTRKFVNSEGEEVVKQYPVQVGSMTIENHTGRILSFVGGRDHEVENLNHSTQAFRSIGSTVKPLLVYGPAIELGKIGAGSPVVDVEFAYQDSSGVWTPENFIPTSEQGIMPARNALAESQNLPAIRLFAQIREQMPVQFMAKAGFSRIAEESDTINANYSSALGGGVEGSVEELTNGYSMVANNGKFVDAYMIERIEDADGNIVFEQEVKEEEVFSPQSAYILTDMLRDVFKTSRGTANRANNWLNFSADFAGKTGTTQDAKDVWLVGYNPNITMTVWLGYGREEYRLNEFPNSELQPSTRVNQVWASLMNATYAVKPKMADTDNTFQAPEGVVTRSFCGISGLAPGTACSNAGLVRSDLFNANVMVPTKADDSLTSNAYTTVNGRRYNALSSTPREFVSGGGIAVSQEFVDRMLAPFGGDASKLLSGSSRFSSVVSASNLNHDGVAPAGVGVSLNGRTLTWSNSASNDVVGYRVYRSGGGNSLLASIPESRSNAYTVPGPGSYFVVAVDITGRQSPLSNTVRVAAPEPEPEPAPTPTPSSPSTDEGSEDSTPPSSGGDGSDSAPSSDEEETSTEEPATEDTPSSDESGEESSEDEAA